MEDRICKHCGYPDTAHRRDDACPVSWPMQWRTTKYEEGRFAPPPSGKICASCRHLAVCFEIRSVSPPPADCSFFDNAYSPSVEPVRPKQVEMIPVSWAYHIANRFYGSDANLAHTTFEKALEELRQSVENTKKEQALDGGAKK